MIKNIALLICMITSCAYSQEVIYFNKSWKLTTKDSAAFYRECKKEEKGYTCTFYNVKGQKHSMGHYRNLEPEVIDGDFIYYNNKGKVSSKTHYVNNSRNGYDITYSKNQKIYCIRKYAEGKLVDTVTSFYPNGILKRYDFYKQGKFVSGKMFDKKGAEISYYPMEEAGGFVGGNAAMAKFIQTNLIYPEEARNKGIEGKVYLKFMIDKKGRIKKIKVEKSVHPLLDKAAVEVLKKMPPWNPAKAEGKPWNCYYAIPISFKLN